MSSSEDFCFILKSVENSFCILGNAFLLHFCCNVAMLSCPTRAYSFVALRILEHAFVSIRFQAPTSMTMSALQRISFGVSLIAAAWSC